MTRTVVLVIVLLAACSSKKKQAEEQPKETPPAAGPVTAEDRALADQWVVLYGEYAAAAEGAGVDCAKAAAAVRAVNDKNADLLARGKSRMVVLRTEPATAAWFDQDVKPKLGAALDRMAPLLDSCRGNADLSAALAAGAFQKKQ